MKTTSLLLVLFIVFFSTAKTFAQSDDESKIKQVLQDETKSYYNRNEQAWASTRLHDANTSASYIGRGGYNRVTSWDSLNKYMHEDFVGYTKTIPVNVSMLNLILRTSGDLAWADYRQILTSANSDTSFSDTSRESRLLVKENGDWKIASQLSMFPKSWAMPQTAAEIENNMNDNGYALMAANRLQEAIEVFKLNVKLNPKSWNPYDSLGEAYAAAGDKQNAIANYEMSVKLNPSNDNGKAVLAKLKK